MADPATQSDSSTLTIPDDVQEKFPEFIKLIKGSQSMDDEERQYWIDVLPIMTDDQMENLKGILDNEKQQIEEAEKEYVSDVNEVAKNFNLEFDEIKYREKKKIRLEAEKQHELEEMQHEEDILAELANL